jgi:hypothetical protein
MGLTFNQMFPRRFLTAEDFAGAPRVVTINSVTMEDLGSEGSHETKPVIRFIECEQRFVLNRVNAGFLLDMTGSGQSDDWIGLPIELYAAQTLFKGRMVNCIRVRRPMVKSAPQPAQEPLTAPAQPVALPAAAPLRVVATGPSGGQPEPQLVTPAQVRLVATVQRHHHISDDQIHAHLHAQYGITSRKAIRQGDLNDVLAWLEERGAMAELEVA